MILLVTASAKASECAEAIQGRIGEEVTIVPSFRQATLSLRQQDYAAVVIDESLEGTEPEASEALVPQLGTSIPVFLHFGVTGIPRVVRELQGALRRRSLELAAARRAAQRALRHDLQRNLKALLLSCELALNVQKLPPLAATRMRAAYDLANELRDAIGI